MRMRTLTWNERGLFRYDNYIVTISLLARLAHKARNVVAEISIRQRQEFRKPRKTDGITLVYLAYRS